MKYTNTMKADGELAVRRMSAEAQAHYNETDPIAVYEYEGDSGKLYAIYEWGEWCEGLTFEQVEAEFENHRLLGRELCEIYFTR